MRRINLAVGLMVQQYIQRAEASVGEVLSEDAVSKLTVVGTEVCEEEGPVPSLHTDLMFGQQEIGFGVMNQKSPYEQMLIWNQQN